MGPALTVLDSFEDCLCTNNVDLCQNGPLGMDNSGSYLVSPGLALLIMPASTVLTANNTSFVLVHVRSKPFAAIPTVVVLL